MILIDEEKSRVLLLHQVGDVSQGTSSEAWSVDCHRTVLVLDIEKVEEEVVDVAVEEVKIDYGAKELEETLKQTVGKMWSDVVL